MARLKLFIIARNLLLLIFMDLLIILPVPNYTITINKQLTENIYKISEGVGKGQPESKLSPSQLKGILQLESLSQNYKTNLNSKEFK